MRFSYHLFLLSLVFAPASAKIADNDRGYALSVNGGIVRNIHDAGVTTLKNTGSAAQTNELNASANNQQSSVRNAAIAKAIKNNLRQLAAAADQYFLENGVVTVTLNQLVGEGKYIRKLTPVDGEDYAKLNLAQSVTQWKIESASGISVTHER